jgi:hypothetical protein
VGGDLGVGREVEETGRRERAEVNGSVSRLRDGRGEEARKLSIALDRLMVRSAIELSVWARMSTLQKKVVSRRTEAERVHEAKGRTGSRSGNLESAHLAE